MANTKEKMKRAKTYIQSGEYEKAKRILVTVDHPTADKWLDKLNRISTSSKSATPVQPQPTTQVIVNSGGGAGCLVQILYFLFIGWWCGGLWLSAAWITMATILLIPVSIWMINRIGQVMALREPRTRTKITMSGGVTVITQGEKQLNLFIRIIYFFLVGWWLSALWMSLGYFFALTIIGMPLGFWMFDRTPSVLTLQR